MCAEKIPTVLITGASSGIGYELAKIFDKENYHLVLVSRNIEKLYELALNLKNPSHILAMDLSNSESYANIYKVIKNKKLTIDVLINNAGFGDHGEFNNSDIFKLNAMMQVNMIAMVNLTKLFLNDMIKNNHGAIINIASVAGFFPGPYMSVYYATKAFVLSFSQSLSFELKNSNITVTAICPGTTKTNFEKNANAATLFKSVKAVSAYEVAQFTYDAYKNKKLVAIYGFKNKLMVFAKRFVSNNFIMKIISRLQK